jgi:cytochrome oxidase Cu insertion factor (SCO1/SenC/PrrC family)
LHIKNIILIILLLTGVSLFIALQKYSKNNYSTTEDTEISISDLTSPRYLAGNFMLPDLNGTRTQLSDYQGSVVLMMFWTTW